MTTVDLTDVFCVIVTDNTMARSSQPSKSSSHKNYAKRGRDSSRKGKSQSRSASKSRSRTRSTGSKGKSTSVRSRSRPTIQAPRGRSAAQPRKAAAGQASANKSRAVSRSTSRPVSTKRRRANDERPVKPKRKMSAYNVFVREQLTGSPDVSFYSNLISHAFVDIVIVQFKLRTRWIRSYTYSCHVVIHIYRPIWQWAI